MRILIEISEEVYQHMMGNDLLKSVHGNICYKAVCNGTPIPDNATNGQIIQTLFKPNRVEKTDDDVIVENYDFSKEWWNAPYQKSGKE